MLAWFTERDMGRVRIIRARRATRKELRDYDKHVKK